MCVSFSLFYLPFMCPTVSNLYNYIYNNKCQFVILICLQTFYKQHLFVTFIQQITSNYMQLYTRLTKLLLTIARFVLPFYIYKLSVCRTFSKQKVLVVVFSRTPSRLLVDRLLRSCLIYLICVQLVHVACCVLVYVYLMQMLLVVYL